MKCAYVIIISSHSQVGISPLYVASEFGHTEVVDALLKNGADPNQAATVMRLPLPLPALLGEP